MSEPETPQQSWTAESAISCLHAWSVENDGREPKAHEWKPAPPGCPTAWKLTQLFGSWRNAMQAAGFSAPGRGQYVREDRRQQLRR